jgi:hypothetical protein
MIARQSYINIILPLIITLLLALLFTSLQAFEYTFSSFSLADGIFGTCFFFATGFHGLHGAPFSVYPSMISNEILNYIYCSIKQLTYPITKEIGEYSMSVKLKEIYPNLIIFSSELCLYGLTYRVQ